MIKYLKSIFNEFVFGNYFIAACALGMIFSTYIINELPLQFTSSAIFVTSATYLLYNFHRHSFHIDYSDTKSIIKTVKVIRLKFSERAGYLFAVLLLIIELFRLPENVFPYLIPLALLAIAYSAPLIKINGKKLRLKEVYFVKTPVIALVWALTTTIIPLVEQNISLLSSFVFWQIVSKTLFIFALCIPFEMRDMEIDRKNNVSTLAVVHGRKFTLVFGVIIIFLEIISPHLMSPLPARLIFALDITSVVALLFIINQNSNRSPFYYKFFVDGTMILRFILLFILARAL